jgi:DNA-binding NtrC family response regulator/class 3 adenylate cyclase/tetratricopeptide (TPR) repeat protein
MANEGWRFLGDSAPVREILASVNRLLPRLGPGRRVPPILLQGETGTGKGLLARTIHESGPRSAGPFVDLNCAAIPATLIEAELFGFERGAFTDARQARTGLVVAAHGGTLFLDEVGLLPEDLQAKLLTVLEAREVRPLGGTRARAVDVSIIAATNRDLREAVRERRFREDLYHRLAVLVFSLPPLRERGPDVLELADAFLARACADHALTKKLGDDARAALAAYRWPGNVRELANLMERVVLFTEGPIVSAADLAMPTGSVAPHPSERQPAGPLPLKVSVDTFTRARVEQALTEARGNISVAADRLGVPRSTLRYQIERFGLTQGGMGRARRRTARAGAPLSERVLARPEKVEGERRQVSVLFADFTEAMDRVAGADPEATRRLFDPVLETMIDAIRRQEGSVNQVRDDGLMALFGAPVAHEDHAVRACYAALSMHERVGHLAEGMRVSLGADIKVRIGVHSGDVALRLIGDEVRLDYGAIPETTHVAARTQQAARAGTTLITAETLRLAEGFIQVVPAGIADMYELRAASAIGSRLAAAMTRRLSHFVGRETETAQLHVVMARARHGRGQIVALVGEPGVGKSRLSWEVASAGLAQGWLVLQTGSVSARKAPPYLSLANLLRGYLGLELVDEPARIHEQLSDRLTGLDVGLCPLASPLLAILDVPFEDRAWARHDARERRRRMLDAALQVIRAASRVAPVMVVVDDLQWVDSETQAFLDLLVDSIPGAPVLLLVNYRPEGEHDWGRKTYYTQVRVDALSASSASALLDALVGKEPSLGGLKRLLIERTEGNPFFIEESVRTLAETGALVGDQGGYRTQRAVTSLQVPVTVESVLAARMDRLASSDKRLLQAAAVIGKDVPYALLRFIADRGDNELHEGLGTLQSAEFLYEVQRLPEVEYTFKHALTHDVAYGSLLETTRRGLHARIVEAIEAIHRERLSEYLEQLADHALRGGLREKAVDYLGRAGQKAAARSALQDARKWFEQALGALETLPESQSTLERAFELRLELRSVLNLLGELRIALERLREAEALAERLNDDHRRGRVWAFMANIHALLEDLDEALVPGTRAVEIAGGLGDLRLRIVATTYLAHVHFLRGEYERVVELATDNIAALPDEWVYEYFASSAPPSVYDRCWLTMSLAQLGRFAEAGEYEAEALRLAEPTRHAYTIGQAYRAAATLRLLKGDWANARSLIEHGIAGYRTGNIVVLLSTALASSAWVLAQLGEASEALGRLRESEQLLERRVAKGIVAYRGWEYHALGRACLLLGRLDEAWTLGDRAVASCLSQPGYAAHALHLLGDVATHPDQFDAERGEARYRQALALAGQLGMRPLVAHCHLGLGKLYRRTGKREQAQKHLAAATTMYREMGMRFWLEQAEAEMKELS